MSFDTAEFMIDVEDTYGFEIPNEDYESLKTVGLLCEYIQKRIPQSDPDAILATICKIIFKHFSIPADEIGPESRWIEDLGLG